MAYRIQITRLAQDELEYELRVRGIAIGTVEEMRHSLSMAIRLEQSEDSVKYPAYPFTVEEDEKAVEGKLVAIVLLVDDYMHDPSGNQFNKLQPKLAHVRNRIDHMYEEKSQKRPHLRNEALAVMNNLHQKVQDEGSSEVPPQLSFMEQSLAFNPSRRSSSPPLPNPIGSPSTSSQVKPILPIKWDIEFSGDRKGPSLSSFLERVEKLRQARHVSKATLLESGIDLNKLMDVDVTMW